jgi:DNA-binding response OmpR family regulator
VMRVGLLHDDVRIRDLYRTILEARGYGVLATTCARAARDPELHGCDLLVVQVRDGPAGLAQIAPLFAHDGPGVVCVDDDPDPRRDRRLGAMGAVAVLHAPVSLRSVVDAVDAHSPAEERPQQDATVHSARVLRDSARRDPVRQVRGVTDRRGRHLLLVSDDLEVALHCFPRSRGLRVAGNVMGAREPVLAGVALSHRDGILETWTDPLGRFELDGVPPGPVALDIRGRGWSLQADIDLGST